MSRSRVAFLATVALPLLLPAAAAATPICSHSTGAKLTTGSLFITLTEDYDHVQISHAGDSLTPFRISTDHGYQNDGQVIACSGDSAPTPGNTDGIFVTDNSGDGLASVELVDPGSFGRIPGYIRFGGGYAEELDITDPTRPDGYLRFGSGTRPGEFGMAVGASTVQAPLWSVTGGATGVIVGGTQILGHTIDASGFSPPGNPKAADRVRRARRAPITRPRRHHRRLRARIASGPFPVQTTQPLNVPLTVQPMPGDNGIIGGDANDQLYSGPGTDVISGGGGANTIHLGGDQSSPDPLKRPGGGSVFASETDTVTFADAVSQGGAGVTYDADSLNASGIAGNWSILGTPSIIGSPGDDILNGPTNPTGSITISGGAGNDTIEPRSSNETLDGGTGVNTLSFADSPVGVTATLSDPRYFNFQNLIGSPHNDHLIGTAGANSIDTGGGSDIVDGLGGDDYIFARYGTVDTIHCGTGNATVVADATDNVNPNCAHVITNVPTATESASTDISSTSATLHGTVNPHGTETHWHWEYNGLSTPEQDAGAGTADVDASYALAGLHPGVTYQAHLVVTSSAPSPRTPGVSFTTREAPSVTVVPDPRGVELAPGQLQTLHVTLQRRGGDTQPERLVVSGLPEGVRSTGGTAAGDSIDLTLTAFSDAPATNGVATATVTATDPTGSTTSAPVRVIVDLIRPAIAGVRVTQGQEWDARAKVAYVLIGGKTTLVRVWLTSVGSTAQVASVRCSFPPFGAVSAVPRAGDVLPSAPQTSDATGSFDCWLPGQDVPVERHSAHFEVRFASGQTASFDEPSTHLFAPTQPVRILVYPWTANPPDQEPASWTPEHVSAVADAMQTIDRAWPVEDGVSTITDPRGGIRYAIAPPWNCPLTNGQQCDATARSLSDGYLAAWNASHPLDQQFDVAIEVKALPKYVPGVNGVYTSGGGHSCNSGSSTAGAGLSVQVPRGDGNLMGQEMAHCFGLVDPTGPDICTTGMPVCGLGSAHSEDDTFGDPATPLENTLLQRDEGQPHSMMFWLYRVNGDDSVYLQGYEWNYLWRKLVAARTPVKPTGGAQNAYAMTGYIHRGSLAVDIGFAGLGLVTPATDGNPLVLAPTVRDPVTLALQMVDGSRHVLASSRFTVGFQSTHGPVQPSVPFSASIAANRRAVAAQLVALGGGGALDTGARLASARVLATVLFPRTAPRISRPVVFIRRGRITVRWHALRGRNLRYRLFLATRHGAGQLLAIDLRSGSYSNQAALLGAGVVRFRVQASDGLHLVSRTSAPIRLRRHRPVVRITQLVPGRVLGVAYDLGAGPVAPSSMSWLIDGRFAGRGALLRLPRLSAGRHSVTLVGRARSGLLGSDTATVDVPDGRR